MDRDSLKSKFSEKVQCIYKVGGFMDGAEKWRYEDPFEARTDCEVFDAAKDLGKMPFYVGFHKKDVTEQEVKLIMHRGSVPFISPPFGRCL